MAVPIIRRHELGCIEKEFLKIWMFEDSAQVVPPLEPGQKEIALWHGQFSGGEAPVLARPITIRELTVNKLPDWYYGIAMEHEVTAAADYLNTLVDAAAYSAGTLPEAIGVLACMVRSAEGSITKSDVPALWPLPK